MKLFLRISIFLLLFSNAILTYSQGSANSSSTARYQLIGSYQNGENITRDMEDNRCEFTELGSVFFKIKDKDNNLYYGGVIPEGQTGSDNKNYTPLAGAYKAAVSDNPEGVGSLYFTVNEGLTYTIIFQEPVDDSPDGNYIISLKIEEIKDGKFDIIAQSNADLTKGMFWPMVLSDEGLENATITSISVSSWDYPFVSERISRVLYWTCPDDRTYHLSDWDEIIGQFETVEDENSQTDHRWIVDETSYLNDAYCYQLVVVMDVEGKSRRFVTNSDRFLINSSGEPLVLRAYYLVQYGVGSGEYYTLPDETTPAVYHVTNLSGSLGNSGNIIFTKTGTDDEEFDFGDEETFRFTDQILIRSNKPYGVEPHTIEKFSLYNVTNPDETVLLIDSETNGNTYNNEEGRFMAIVECQIKEQEYKLVLDYRDESGNSRSLEAYIKKAVTIPSPKIQESYIEFYKGFDNGTDSDNDTFTFRYPSLSRPSGSFLLTGARYHNLRQYVKLSKPNTTEVLGQKMLDVLSGSFSYFYDCIKNGQEVNRVNLRFQSDNSGEKQSVVWETTGPCVIPEELLSSEQGGNYDSRILRYTHNFPTTVYDRWGDGTLKQLQITDEAPVDSRSCPAVIETSHLTYKPTSTGQYFNLVEDFTVKIKLDDVADANNVIYNDGRMNGDLMHQSANDYYYVVIVDTQTEGFDPNSATMAEYIPTTGNQSYPEYVFTAEELNNGVEINFTHTHGRPKKDMVWDEDVENAFNNPYSNNLQLRISYLYPFRTYRTTESVQENAETDAVTAPLSIQKIGTPSSEIPSNLHGDVIMSKPLIFDLAATKVTTGVNDLTADDTVSVSAGQGYISAMGCEATVYTVDGRKIAAGSGVIPLSPGIYLVSDGQNFHKVKVW